MSRHYLSPVIACVLLCAACGDRAVTATVGPGDDVGYSDTVDVVSVGGTTWIVSGEPGSDCVDLGGQCVNITDVKRQACGDPNAQADIVIVDGKVVDVICYPPRSSGVGIETATTSQDGKVTLPQSSKDRVIIFGAETNGKPVTGDVKIDAENVSIIGNGVDKTILAGNVTMASNNSHLRGLTIEGNLVFEKNANNATAAFCKVKGNLEVHSNDVIIMSCQIFGDLKVSGNGVSLLGVGVGGKLTVEGSGSTCQGVYQINDANGDKVVQPTEKGAALTCK